MPQLTTPERNGFKEVVLLASKWGTIISEAIMFTPAEIELIRKALTYHLNFQVSAKSDDAKVVTSILDRLGDHSTSDEDSR